MRRAKRCRRSRRRRPTGLELKLDFDQSVFVRAAVQNVIREAIISSILVSVADPGVPGKLAQHGDRLHLDPAVDLRRHRRAVPHRQHDQPDDAGRAGAGDRPAGRQRHRHDREHPPQPVAGQAADGGDPRRQQRGDPAADRRDAGDLHRVLPGRAAVRRGALSCSFRWPPPSCSACWRPTCCRSAWCRRSRASCWRPRRSITARRAASSRMFDRGFNRFRDGYGRLLEGALHRRVFVLLCAGGLLVVSLGLGTRDRPRFLPHRRCRPDQAALPRARRARGSSGPRNWCCRSRTASARSSRRMRLDTINDTVGVPSSFNLAFVPTDNVGAMDAEILISLKPGHHPSIDYIRAIRARLPDEFPGSIFYFQTADIVSQVLNFGLSAPIDVQIQDVNFERASQLGQQAAGAHAADSRRGRRASGAGAELSGAAGGRGPAARRQAERLAARRGQQHAHVAVVERRWWRRTSSSIRRTT